MKDAQPRAIKLSDYKVPPYLIDETHLEFELGEEYTLVRSRLSMRLNPAADTVEPLVLDGVELELMEVEIDGKVLPPSAYHLTESTLTIATLPTAFELACVTRINPAQNTALEGLYKSHSMYCTQCEAEGFRKITYYLDRPDVMSVFTVRVEASELAFPILLSNGNLIDSGAADEGRHFSVWHDPFPKPSYLFALVAGNLQRLQDNFTTVSGRAVELNIYVEAKDIGKVDYAMESLIASMRWDEEVYGREYDLDLFNIVAVDDFNMGAMENKSLNVFNTSCVLAHPSTSTDASFQRVEGVVAHEYFHNWSGNRVTCRDWFQLSLKEGFTVFRDAEFSSDQGSRTVKRVEDVKLLRAQQFPEDAGPLAHPIRPESFIEINNFYTRTIYEKGAEVVRMIHQLLGSEHFRRGSDLYFERHDGQAVTCDEFVNAMADSSGRDLNQFKRWYSQSGTPVLKVAGHYDADAKSYRLDVEQSCPATPGQTEKLPLHIPLAVGLIGEAGDLRLQLEGEGIDQESADNTFRVLEITEALNSFVFINIEEEPVPSLLRDFSAPVHLNFDYSRAQLGFIMSRDSNGFCRWDAAQQLAIAVIEDQVAAILTGSELTVDTHLVEAFRQLLEDRSLDPAMIALMLKLPEETYLIELADKVDVSAIHRGRERVKVTLADQLYSLFEQRYGELESSVAYQPTAEQVANRSLRNVCLGYMMSSSRPAQATEFAGAQFRDATNMTDQLAALLCLVNGVDRQAATQALDSFHQQWSHESLVLNSWLQVQAQSPHADVLDQVRALLDHPDFEITNPNRVRSLIGVFSRGNPVNFHREDGAGYELLADIIIALDALNPQTAAGLLDPFTQWQRFPATGQIMERQLQRILGVGDISADVFEIASKSLVPSI
ncbi:MAG: aminopeptidase N [Halieaceae bacterium]|jgi:aminopeptidase N